MVGRNAFGSKASSVDISDEIARMVNEAVPSNEDCEPLVDEERLQDRILIDEDDVADDPQTQLVCSERNTDLPTPDDQVLLHWFVDSYKPIHNE